MANYKVVKRPSFGSKKNTGGSTRRSKSEREILRTAYRMGQVQRGLKNSESKISQSYERGQKQPEYKKRTLF